MNSFPSNICIWGRHTKQANHFWTQALLWEVSYNSLASHLGISLANLFSLGSDTNCLVWHNWAKIPLAHSSPPGQQKRLPSQQAHYSTRALSLYFGFSIPFCKLECGSDREGNLYFSEICHPSCFNPRKGSSCFLWNLNLFILFLLRLLLMQSALTRICTIASECNFRSLFQWDKWGGNVELNFIS